MPSSGRYTHAVVARVPESFHLVPSTDGSCIALDRAKEQHAALTSCLRGLGIDVLEMEPEEGSPESVFARDCAVTLHGIALICRPGGELQGRLQDCLSVRAVLKNELGLVVVDLNSPAARLSGADVLFTGKEFFVGLGSGTNMEGALCVAATWPEYPCVPVRLEGGRPLGDRLALAGPGIISVGTGRHSQNLLRRVEREATVRCPHIHPRLLPLLRYQTLTLPEDEAANCIYANRHLLHPPATEAPLSARVFSERIEFATREISMSEFQKTGRGISSLCILLRKDKTIRKI
jgi:dimethylargininase